MGNMQKEFEEKVQKNPDQNFKVVMVYDDESVLEILPADGFQKLMKNIASATLSGRQITELSTNQNILSIEEDAPMHTME